MWPKLAAFSQGPPQAQPPRQASPVSARGSPEGIHTSVTLFRDGAKCWRYEESTMERLSLLLSFLSDVHNDGHISVKDEAPFTRVAVGGISSTCSARRAAAFTGAVFCIEAPVGRRQQLGKPPAQEMIPTWGQRSQGCEHELLLLSTQTNHWISRGSVIKNVRVGAGPVPEWLSSHSPLQWPRISLVQILRMDMALLIRPC
ncbi:uncharacterized protein [Equus przewalskii]|uniref:Uncharacterized protein n=1 Tax=Equus przewalskii TaxID=9798 RepID=A0ABM4M2M5_EQUPR